MLATITTAVELFIIGAQSIDFNFYSPFVTFSVYKAAAIATERLLIDGDSNAGLKSLKILRNFLRVVGERWMCCGKLCKTFEEWVELTEHL